MAVTLEPSNTPLCDTHHSGKTDTVLTSTIRRQGLETPHVEHLRELDQPGSLCQACRRQHRPNEWNELNVLDNLLPPTSARPKREQEDREVALSAGTRDHQRRGSIPGAPAEGADVYHSRTGGGALGSHLAEQISRRFGSTEAGLIERVQSAASWLSSLSATVTRSITMSSIRCW